MIEIELSLQEKKRKPCRDFLKVCRAEYDNLLESSPNIDLDIINFFNKKFDGKYPGVRRPLICNGLKAITPYRLPENTDKIKDKLEVIVEDDDGVEPEIETIAPKANRLAVFLSETLHEVKNCNNERRSITGWLLDIPTKLTFLG